ncbi:tetratricopeptide repeat protein [Candidatus Methylomicrobium oryzae]|uniref:tetratricopeptide repeat protein n=1 Tax=Candidatus Methylomicrobium oryzae TaxID=2802053 RepID=UPI001921DC15|nr:hypothetical protein [Methylomicrobium sp. RS1]MBL1263465.1 hypothetical protein [Methylomicrobium sp. RS1]
MLLNKNAFYILLIITIVTSGCTWNIPLVVDPTKDMYQSQLGRKKMPIKVGMYLSDDLKQYVYKQQKMGMTFQMRAGEYLPLISMKMASTMFDGVILVNSLPPYNDSYRPDVEAVIRPEILFCYGNAIGTFSGYIEAKVKLRITAYDLDGNTVWQDEATAESRSNDMFFANSYEEIGTAGYQAGFSATTNIVNNFYAKPPQELFSLLEIKKAENLRNQGTLPDFELFKELYEKGLFQYDKKNYHQSLYLFEKASIIDPDEPAALFPMGASYIHIGEKDRALKKFEDVIAKKPSKQEVNDSKKYIQLLNAPLKIGIISGNKSNKSTLNDVLIHDALIHSGMYEIIDIAELVPTNNLMTPQFFARCYKKGVKIIILHDVDSFSQKAQSSNYSGGDVATDHIVKISAKIYSTKKMNLKTEVQINERTSTIQGQTVEEEMNTRQQLLQNGAKKLVLQLLKNDIL